MPGPIKTCALLGVSLCAAACLSASGARPPPSAAELNARADIEEATASTAPSDDAKSLRESAAAHRRAAGALLEREAEVCAGVAEADRAHPPFLLPVAIDAVRPAMGERRLVKSFVKELRGAELTIRATAGLTKQWLAREVRCHLAWHDVVGRRAHEPFEDPFLVGTPMVSFDEVEMGFVIRIVGNDKAEGSEILRRAWLVATSSAPPLPVP